MFCLVCLFVLCSQGYQEHRCEAARPSKKNCLQHPGSEGPDQHSERVCCVMAAKEKEKKKEDIHVWALRQDGACEL